MGFELDHIFILTDINAEIADPTPPNPPLARGGKGGSAQRLSSFGLSEGSSRIHSGQGTANRRFFFHNAYLELLWVNNPEEAKSEEIYRTRLWERWRDRHNGACPFGFCLRCTSS